LIDIIKGAVSMFTLETGTAVEGVSAGSCLV